MTDAGSPVDSHLLLQTLGAFGEPTPSPIQAKLITATEFDVSKRSGRLSLFDANGEPLRLSDAMTVPPPASTYYTAYPQGATASTALGGANRLFIAPVILPAGTITEMVCEVTIIATSGGRVRMGIWKHDYNTGLAGELVVDSGQVLADDATGQKTVAVSAVIPKTDWYWIGAACQAQTCGMRTASGGNTVLPRPTPTAGSAASMLIGSVSGAFTDNPGSGSGATNCPWLQFRWA